MVAFVFFLSSTNFAISFFVKGHGTFTIYLKKEEKQDITTYLLWSLEQNNTHSTIISMHKGPSLYYVRVFWGFLEPPTPYALRST